MLRRPVTVLAFFLAMAGVVRAEELSAELQAFIEEVLTKVGELKPMPYGQTYTLTVGGKSVTADPDYFLRRRTGAEILASGYTSGCGDSALAAYHLIQQRGYEVQFVDAAQVSTESLVNGFSGHATVAIGIPTPSRWVRLDLNRHNYSWPWTETDKHFYGNYWIGFRGPLSKYPAHDPESLKKFYRDTLNKVPIEFWNKTLFRFRFTVDPSLIAPGGKYKNPNLERMLQNNGKDLAAHGIQPETIVPVLLTAGSDNAESRLNYEWNRGWVCSLGLKSAAGLGLVSYIENRLVQEREDGKLKGVIEPPPPSHRNQWIAFGFLCAALAALLVWQRRRLIGRETLLAYWICQLVGWGTLPVLGLIFVPNKTVNVYSSVAVFFVLGILLTGLLRNHIKTHDWLTLAPRKLFPRLALAVLIISTVLSAAGIGSELVCHAFAGTELPEVTKELQSWISCIVMLAIWVILYILFTGPRRHREATVRMQLALREAELRALESQLEPHFLFNCLNSIRGLVAENPAMAQDMLTRLANILRYNLRREMEHTVPLASEVEIVSDYLALESARFEDRLRIHLSIDPDAGAVQVPPMLLQSLVENALKHGIAPLPEGGDLRIRATVVGESMLMEVENPGEVHAASADATQMGLANIRERLRLLYHGRASFDLKNREGHVAAIVLVPRIA